MKYVHVSILLAIISLTMLPVFAQNEPGRGPRPLLSPDERPLPGKIVAVDPAQRMVRLALYMRVPRSDEPGQVPDEMARQAASLSEQVTLLERQEKFDAAQRLRRQVEELLCWREIEQVMTNVDGRAVIGLRRASFDDIRKGMRLRCVAGVNGRVAANAVPERMTLAKDAVQTPGRPQPMLRRVNGAIELPRTFFEFVGDVTGTNPLVVQIGEYSVQLDTPPEFGFLQAVPQDLRELQPGMRVLARMTFNPAAHTRTVQRLAVMLYRAEMPFAAGELLDE